MKTARNRQQRTFAALGKSAQGKTKSRAKLTVLSNESMKEPPTRGGDGERLSRAQIAGAFSIHLLTASGAGIALLALMAAADHAWSQMFLWLGLALLVDGLDGPLARRVSLSERLPRWSGETLDLVVDFVTYVFVPAYAMAVSGLLPDGVGTVAGLAVVVSSALYFADGNMKMEDNYFSGFPAIWNAAAFYLFLLAPPPWVGAAFIAALVVMTFLPIPFIHPVRVVRMRKYNIVFLVIWSVLALVATAHDMNPGPWVTGALGVFGVYILCGGLLRRAK